MKRRTGCRVVAPEKARGQVPVANAYVRESDTVRVGELAVDVWETPGHCADHVAYWFAADRALFAGDTIFTLGCGRVMETTHAQMWNSLTRLAALPDHARVYSGGDAWLSSVKSFWGVSSYDSLSGRPACSSCAPSNHRTGECLRQPGAGDAQQIATKGQRRHAGGDLRLSDGASELIHC